ncbi:hypothetical protein ILT44_08305 [Microvirga sp. BT689]|uniref:hypothetical protein n=1 Tax=Microvirga arvi TaxID=2778731 RepID=UPI001951A72B|nr:hypothetical protein [Microvirga arvi]MBM6580179.1 hypothetical protein [Microvirga arvi]
MFFPLMKLATDTTMLAAEAQMVIWTRLSQAAMGRGSNAENLLMVTEKITAFTEAASIIAAGGSAHKVIKGYRRKVRANAKRLSR